MDERNEKTLRIAVIVVFTILIAFSFFWYIDLSDNGRTADGLGKQLDDIGTEQQQAADNLDRVADGLTSSIASVGCIEQSGIDAQKSVDGIAATNSGIKESITNASAGYDECQVILGDSEQRINDSRVILQTVRSTAKKNRATP